MVSLIDMLFGCCHRRLSFPLTAKNRRSSTAAKPTGTYVVCLSCGKEFPYDWQRMRVVSSAEEVSDSLPEPAGAVFKRTA
jgi:RNase P subunit RPR2